jgi:hypothetical protein
LKKKKHGSKHHIIPKSRGGSNEPKNISTVESKRHNLYHQLFGNRTPPEIIRMLREEFWKGGEDA